MLRIRKHFYLRITTASDFASEMRAHCPAFVWNTVPNLSSDEIASVIRKLITSGCRYIVAAGTECERWDDIADEQFIALFPTHEEQDANQVVTTAHANESPEEATFYLVNCTNLEEYDFKESLFSNSEKTPQLNRS